MVGLQDLVAPVEDVSVALILEVPVELRAVEADKGGDEVT